MSSSSQTGIEVRLSFFWGAFFLYACMPRIEIDGAVEKRYWGSHFFATSSGKHNIKVYYRYLAMDQCGANDIDVTVTEGNITTVEYFMYPWMFAKGALKTVGKTEAM
jgi:hypothetical protein